MRQSTPRPAAPALAAPARALPVLLLLAGCAARPPALTADDPAVRTRLADAAELTGEFRQRLGRALNEAVRDRGFAGAIDVCAQAAPAIAGSFARPDRRVYRVGTRARNARHGTPDALDRRLLTRLARAPQDPAWELERDAAGTATGLRYARGIAIRAALCLKCHGGPDDLAPGVREALKAAYPNDQATGYKMGDLRGAFVVRYRL